MKKVLVYSASLDRKVEMEVSMFNNINKLQNLCKSACELMFGGYKIDSPELIKLNKEIDKVNNILNSKGIWKEYKRVTWCKVE